MTETIKLAIVISAAFRGGAAFDKAGGGLKGFTAALKRVRAEIMLLAGYAAFNFLKKGFAVFVQFEQRMAEAGSIVGATKEEIADFSEEIKAMTRELPQTADELGAGLYDVFSAGVTDSAEAMETLRLAAQAAVAGLTSTAQAVKAGVSTMNAFGLSMDDLNHIYDVQFLTIRKGILRYDDLVEQVGKLAPSANAAGQSMEDMFGTLAFLTTKGMRAAQAATALSRAYDALTMPATIKKFRELGIAVADMSDATMRTDPLLVGMRQAIEDADAELSRMNATIQTTTADYESQGVELNELEMAYNATKEAMSDFGDEMSDISLTQRKNRLEVSKIKQQADKEDRDLTKEELTRIEEIEAANNDLRITYEELGIQQTVLSKVADEQEEKVNAASVAYEKTGKEVESLNELQVSAVEALEKTTDAYDAQIAQTGKFRPLVDIVSDLNTEMEGMSEVAKAQLIAKIFPQIRARKAIVGIIGDTQTLTANINEMSDATMSGGAMQEAFATNVDTTANEIKMMNNSVQELQMSFTQDILPAIKSFMEIITPMAQFLAANTEVIWALIAAFIAYKVATIIATISTWGLNMAMLANPVMWLVIAIAALIVMLVLLWMHWDEVVVYLQNFADYVMGGLKAALDWLLGAFEALKEIPGKIAEWFGNIKDTITDAFAEMILSAFQWGIDMINNFIQGIKDATGGVGDAVGGVWDTITGWIGFDIRANDEMAKKWGADLGKYFSEGIVSSLPDVGVAGAEVINSVEGGMLNTDAINGATMAAPTGQSSNIDSHDVYEVTIRPDKIEEGMDMKKFGNELAQEASRQKKTKGGG